MKCWKGFRPMNREEKESGWRLAHIIQGDQPIAGKFRRAHHFKFDPFFRNNGVFINIGQDWGRGGTFLIFILVVEIILEQISRFEYFLHYITKLWIIAYLSYHIRNHFDGFSDICAFRVTFIRALRFFIICTYRKSFDFMYPPIYQQKWLIFVIAIPW